MLRLTHFYGNFLNRKFVSWKEDNFSHVCSPLVFLKNEDDSHLVKHNYLICTILYISYLPVDHTTCRQTWDFY